MHKADFPFQADDKSVISCLWQALLFHRITPLKRDMGSLKISLIFLHFARVLSLYVNDECDLPGEVLGICRLLSKCKPAIEAFVSNGIRPQHCGFEGFEEVVCCPRPIAANLIQAERPSKRACSLLREKLDTEFRIIGGRAALLDEYPHMAALGYDHPKDPNDIEWRCGGSLISESYVLTAAHCLDFGSPKFVLLGSLQIHMRTEPEAQLYEVEEYFIHPNYTKTVYNDLALLHLSKSVNYSEHIYPACLYSKPDIKHDLNFTVTGWGVKSSNSILMSSTLQTAMVMLVSQESCREQYANVRNVHDGIDDSMLCAKNENNKDGTCKGDSGGPLFMSSQGMFYIVGITSYGLIPCGKYPTIYTRIYSYLDWIESIVWP